MTSNVRLRAFRACSVVASLAATVATAAAQPVQGSAKASDEELVKQLADPVASLISVPFQNNLDFNLEAGEGWRYTMNFQPVVPIKLDRDWNLIIRTIVPFIHQEDVFKGALSQVTLPDDVIEQLKGKPSRCQTGVGDITQSFLFSPSSEPFGIDVGVGPAFLCPAATEELLGSGKWGAGAKRRRLDRYLLRPALSRHRQELDRDRPWPRLVRDPAALRSAKGFFDQSWRPDDIVKMNDEM